MNKIRVLQVVDSIQYGGVENVIFNYISNLDLNKFQFTIVTAGERYLDAEKKFKDLNIKIYSLPRRKSNPIKYIFGLRKIIKEGKYDIIHSHIDYWSFIPLYFGRKYNVKNRISHIHCTCENNLKIKILSKLTVKYSNTKLACSISAGNSIYGKNEYKVINNGIDVNKFKFNNNIRNEIRKKYNIDSSDIVIGHVGRFCFIKNHNFIIDLFNEFYKTQSNSKLMLVGDGEFYDECVKKVNALGLNENVIFTGSVENIYEIYQAFDIFVLPSIKEGFGIAVLEAQCSGLKCMVSTGIPKEVNIAETVKFLPIKNNNEWINYLKNINFNFNRLENSKIIEMSK